MQELLWTAHPASLVNQRLYFPRMLRTADLSLLSFYRCSAESILTYGMLADRRALQRVIKTAQQISSTQLPSLEDIYRTSPPGR